MLPQVGGKQPSIQMYNEICNVLSTDILKKADICACGHIQGMEGAKIGIWCAHGEGQARFPEAQVYQDVLAQDLAPIRCAQAGTCAALHVQTSPMLSSPDRMGRNCNALGPNGWLVLLPALQSCTDVLWPNQIIHQNCSALSACRECQHSPEMPHSAERMHLIRRYTDASGSATEAYPFNPNGSPEGIAALTSANGRHLALMPHPERCFLTWQLPWCACFSI